MTVVTRFAPSPTGFLHIGSARTALFCKLFARHHGGKFLLRIEDTDRERSTQEATQAIMDGLVWLGLQWDGREVYQANNATRHKEIAEQLLAEGKAYRCYASAEELKALREAGSAYDRRWRERSHLEAPVNVKHTIRLKSPLEGEVVIKDHVRGDVRVSAAQLEDLILLRSDGTPTYNLAVVVDDHDMGVTHIIRGEDHLTNAAKQTVIYQLMGWKVPEFAHIPLIHGPDGGKLSKRHGALGVEAYHDMGYLPEALRNYLLRLGWSHGDDEIISDAQAVEWFTLEGIGKSPSRFDFTKLESLNGYYIRQANNERLANLIIPMLQQKIGHAVSPQAKERLVKGMEGLKARAKTMVELADSAVFYVRELPLVFSDKAHALLNEEGRTLLKGLLPVYEALEHWSESYAQSTAKQYAEEKGLKLGAIAQPLRAALTGSHISPSVFEVMEVLGKEETLARIRDIC